VSRKDEIRKMAEALIRAHDGQAYFNFSQSAKIIGCGINTVARELHKAGITVKRVGPSKRVSVYDLAAYMYDDRVAPIDNRSWAKARKV